MPHVPHAELLPNLGKIALVEDDGKEVDGKSQLLVPSPAYEQSLAQRSYSPEEKARRAETAEQAQRGRA